MFQMERFAVVKHDTLGFLPLSYHQGLYTLYTNKIKEHPVNPITNKKIGSDLT